MSHGIKQSIRKSKSASLHIFTSHPDSSLLETHNFSSVSKTQGLTKSSEVDQKIQMRNWSVMPSSPCWWEGGTDRQAQTPTEADQCLWECQESSGLAAECYWSSQVSQCFLMAVCRRLCSFWIPWGIWQVKFVKSCRKNRIRVRKDWAARQNLLNSRTAFLCRLWYVT